MRALPITIAAVQALAADHDFDTTAGILKVRRTQLRSWLHGRAYFGWPPHPRIIVGPSREVVMRRAAELHAKLENGPHAIDRLICLIRGDMPLKNRQEVAE